MSRPLLKLGVVQLEAMFARSRADNGVLTQLKDELRHRDTGRAVALLSEVDAALKALPKDDSTVNRKVSGALSAREAVQGELESTGARVSASPVQPDLLSFLKTSPPARPAEAIPNRERKAEIKATTIFSLTLSDARDLLGVSHTASWQEVEEKRRKLVQPAFPGKLAADLNADKRVEIEEKAARANAAHAVLWAEKMSRGG